MQASSSRQVLKSAVVTHRRRAFHSSSACWSVSPKITPHQWNDPAMRQYKFWNREEDKEPGRFSYRLEISPGEKNNSLLPRMSWLMLLMFFASSHVDEKKPSPLTVLVESLVREAKILSLAAPSQMKLIRRYMKMHSPVEPLCWELERHWTS